MKGSTSCQPDILTCFPRKVLEQVLGFKASCFDTFEGEYRSDDFIIKLSLLAQVLRFL